MDTLFTGHNFINLAEVDSTNSFALELLKSAPAEGTVVCARHQTTGRGQKGTTWLDEPGMNLTLSVIYYPTFVQATRAWDLSRLACLAVFECVRQQLPESKVEIKWPNDILADGRKIAGILIENQIEGSVVKRTVIGIGLNVNQTDFPESAYKKATSLRLCSGKVHEIDVVMTLLLGTLEAMYLAQKAGRIARMESEYLQHLRGYQEMIPVKISGETATRMLVGVDPQGRLALEHQGKLHYYDVKEAEVVV